MAEFFQLSEHGLALLLRISLIDADNSDRGTLVIIVKRIRLEYPTITCGGRHRFDRFTVNIRLGYDPNLGEIGVECEDPPSKTPALETIRAIATQGAVQGQVNVFISSWDEREVAATATQTVRLSLSSNQTIHSARLHRIDDSHANPRAVWVEMGSPAVPNQAQLEVLKKASEVPTEPLEAKAGRWELAVPPNAAYVVELFTTA